MIKLPVTAWEVGIIPSVDDDTEPPPVVAVLDKSENDGTGQFSLFLGPFFLPLSEQVLRDFFAMIMEVPFDRVTEFELPRVAVWCLRFFVAWSDDGSEPVEGPPF